MHYNIEIHRQFVYAFAEIQNPKQMFKIQFLVSQHILTEALIEKRHYRIEIHRKFVYVFAEIQNPKRMPKI